MTENATEDGGVLQRYWPNWLPNRPPVWLWYAVAAFLGFGTLATSNTGVQYALLLMMSFAGGFGSGKWSEEAAT